jgi:Fe-S cluster biogenesis protein NfuA
MARSLFQDTLQSLLSFYGDGLARVLQLVAEGQAQGKNVFESLIHDPGVSGLLLIHGLHPLDLAARASEALDKVRPYMESHGGSVELLSLEGGVAHLRLRGTCKSCPSSSVTLELAVRRALEEACPDLAGFQVE